MRVLQPATGSPTPESIRALANLFGGSGGFVSHDTILAVVRLPQSVLTTRLYSLWTRHTLEEFLATLANVHARVRLRTPRSAVGAAKTLTEKEARLEFAFELYDLDGDGFVTEAELLEIVDKTMKGNGAKIKSVLRVASEACFNTLTSEELRRDGPSFRFAEFKNLADRVPTLLFPAQALYELMRENAAHAETALRALRAESLCRGDSGIASSLASATHRAGRSRGHDGSPTAHITRGTVKTFPSSSLGHVMSEGEARARCASLSKRTLSRFLEDIGMDLGLDLMEMDELADLAAAGALSTGRALPALTPETERRGEERDARVGGERGGDAANGDDSPNANENENDVEPSSSPTSSGRRAPPPRRRGKSLAEAFAAGPPPSPSTTPLADAFRAARMGRADALEAMIRGGEVHRDAVDASSDFAFTLLMAAAMSGARGACKRLLSLGADASATDARGRTALDLALEYGHDAVADLLARKGAPFGDPAKDGKDGAAEARDANASAEPSAPPAPAGGFASAATPPAGGTVAALVPASKTSPGSDGGIPPRDEGPLLSPE
jgi:hypothetical protein